MISDFVKIKDPDDSLVFGFNWVPWLAEGEIIKSHELTTSASSLLITDDYHTSGSVIFIASGGESGKRYFVKCKIETEGALVQIANKTMKIDIKNR